MEDKQKANGTNTPKGNSFLPLKCPENSQFLCDKTSVAYVWFGEQDKDEFDFQERQSSPESEQA